MSINNDNSFRFAIKWNCRTCDRLFDDDERSTHVSECTPEMAIAIKRKNGSSTQWTGTMVHTNAQTKSISLYYCNRYCTRCIGTRMYDAMHRQRTCEMLKMSVQFTTHERCTIANNYNLTCVRTAHNLRHGLSTMIEWQIIYENFAVQSQVLRAPLRRFVVSWSLQRKIDRRELMKYKHSCSATHMHTHTHTHTIHYIFLFVIVVKRTADG